MIMQKRHCILLRNLFAALLLSSPLSAQTITVPFAQWDSARAEAQRSSASTDARIASLLGRLNALEVKLDSLLGRPVARVDTLRLTRVDTLRITRVDTVRIPAPTPPPSPPPPPPAPDTAPTPAPVPVPQGITILAEQRWQRQLGTSNAAVLGETATRLDTGGGLLSVVAPSSVGYPFDSNVLRLLYSPGWGHVVWDRLFPLPAAGQFWAFTYDTMNETGQTSTEQHPHTFWPVGAIEATHLQYIMSGAGDGSWIPGIVFNHSTWAPFGLRPYRTLGQRSSMVVLPPARFTRHSYILAWDGPNSARLFAKVDQIAADGTITPLITPNMWSSTEDGQNRTSLLDWYAQSPNNRARRSAGSAGPDNIRTFAFGRAQSITTSGRAYFIAGFRAGLVRSETDWLPGVGPR